MGPVMASDICTSCSGVFGQSTGRLPVPDRCMSGNPKPVKRGWSVAPVLSRGTHTAIDDVDPAHTFVVAPVAQSYRIKPEITVVSISGLFAEIGNIL